MPRVRWPGSRCPDRRRNRPPDARRAPRVTVRTPLDALERTALAAAGGPTPALVSAVSPSGNVGALLIEHRPSATVG